MPPPLGRQDRMSASNCMQNCGMPPPPPFASWAEGLITQRVCFVRFF